MKQSCLTILIFFLSNVCLLPQESIKVMTFNLMGMKPDTDWETRLSYTIQQLKSLNPDIIGLQEINQPRGGAGGINMAETIADSLEAFFETNYFVYQEITHTSWG